MENLHRKVLRKNQPYLVESIDELEDLTTALNSIGIFSDQMVEEILSQKTKRAQIREFLKLLPTRGPRAYENFIKCLQENDQGHIAQKLLESQSEISGVPLPSPDETDYVTEGILDFQILNASSDLLKECQDNNWKDTYRMVSKPRGLALIINNKHFINKTERHGTDVDCANITKLFEQLDVRITETVNDATASVIQQKFREFSTNRLHIQCDIAIAVILSHGAEGDFIYGSDDEKVELGKLISMVDAENCPGMAGKPKLFLIQACRGSTKDYGTTVSVRKEEVHRSSADSSSVPQQASEDASDGGLPDFSSDMYHLSLIESSPLIKQTAPTFADFLIAYATVPGYVSWRERGNRGSYFLQALVKMFAGHVHNEDALSILTKVNREVSLAKIADNQYKMIPAPVNSLTKKVYFFPGL